MSDWICFPPLSPLREASRDLLSRIRSNLASFPLRRPLQDPAKSGWFSSAATSSGGLPGAFFRIRTNRGFAAVWLQCVIWTQSDEFQVPQLGRQKWLISRCHLGCPLRCVGCCARTVRLHGDKAFYLSMCLCCLFLSFDFACFIVVRMPFSAHCCSGLLLVLGFPRFRFHVCKFF